MTPKDPTLGQFRRHFRVYEKVIGYHRQVGF